MTPWYYSTQRERRDFPKFINLEFQRVDPQPVNRGMTQRLDKGRILITEEMGHALEKQGGEGDGFRHKTIIIAICASKI